MSYGMNVWTREIFDALQTTNSHKVLFLSIVYLLLLAGSTVAGVMHVYSRMTVQRRWREWLTNQLIDRWVKNGRYYQLTLVSGAPATPNAAWPTMSGLRPNPGRSRHRVGNGNSISGDIRCGLVEHRRRADRSRRRDRRNHSRISCRRSNRSRAGGKWSHAPHWSSADHCVRTQEPSRGRVPLRPYPHSGKRREHCSSSGRTRRASWHRQVFPRCPARMAKDLYPNRADHNCFPKQRIHRGSFCRLSYVPPNSWPRTIPPLGEVMQAAWAFTIVLGAFNWLMDNYPRLADWTASARRVAALQISLDGLDRAEIPKSSAELIILKQAGRP